MTQKIKEIKTIEWFDDRFYKVCYVPEGETETLAVYAPSVTTILSVAPKPFLAHWRGEIGNREAEAQIFDSQERGKRIHHAWHMLCKGGRAVFNPYTHPQYTREQLITFEKEKPLAVLTTQDEWWALIKLVEFMKVTKAEIVETEKTVFSEARIEAGTLDNVFRVEKGSYPVNGAKPLTIETSGLYIADLKTGKSIYDEAFLQLSAYERFYFEMTGNEIAGGLILHTSSQNKKGIEGLGVTVITRNEFARHFEEYDLLSKLWHRHHEHLQPVVRELPTEVSL